MQDEIDAAIK